MKKWLCLIGLIFLFAANITAANADFFGERREVTRAGQNLTNLTKGMPWAEQAFIPSP